MTTHSSRISTSFIIIAALMTLGACGRAVPPTSVGEGDLLDLKEYTQVMRTGGDLVDPVHGKEVKFWYGALAGVNGVNANGVGFIHLFEDGVSIVTVNLNVQPVQAPARYIVRLTDADGGRPIDIGVLESIIGDARHAAKGQTRDDVSDHLRVAVFLKNGTQETLAAEGMLKIPSKAR